MAFRPFRAVFFFILITQGGAALTLGCYVLPFQGKGKVGVCRFTRFESRGYCLSPRWGLGEGWLVIGTPVLKPGLLSIAPLGLEEKDLA